MTRIVAAVIALGFALGITAPAIAEGNRGDWTLKREGFKREQVAGVGANRRGGYLPGAGFVNPEFNFYTETEIGVGFLVIPTIGAGTVGNSGSESALVRSDGTLTGASFRVGGSIPISGQLWGDWWRIGDSDDFAKARSRAQQFPGLQYQFGPRVNINAGYSTLRGTASGKEPTNGRNVAITYLFPNPATGTTGVNAFAGGESVDIKTKVRMVNFDINYSQPVAGGVIRDSSFWVLDGSAGFHFSYSRGQQWIGTQILNNPGVNSETELINEDYFAGPRFGMDLRIQDGPLYFGLGAWFVPGFYLGKGFADQHNLCGNCGNPGDRDFRLERNDINRSFGVQAGVYFHAGIFLTDNILLGVDTNYSYISKMGGYKNPISPTGQPVRYDTNDAHEWRASLKLKFLF